MNHGDSGGCISPGQGPFRYSANSHWGCECLLSHVTHVLMPLPHNNFRVTKYVAPQRDVDSHRLIIGGQGNCLVLSRAVTRLLREICMSSCTPRTEAEWDGWLAGRPEPVESAKTVHCPRPAGHAVGCHCTECRAWNAARQRDWRRRTSANFCVSCNEPTPAARVHVQCRDCRSKLRVTCRDCCEPMPQAKRPQGQAQCRRCRSANRKTQPDNCSQCGKPVNRMAKSADYIVCWDCRRVRNGPLVTCRVCDEPMPNAKRPQGEAEHYWHREYVCKFDGCGIAIAKDIRERGTDRLMCREHALGSTHIERAKRYGVPWGIVDPQEVFDACDWTCGLCEIQVEPSLRHPHRLSGTLDHVVPLSKPGSPGHVRSNCQLAHFICNGKKGDGRPVDLDALQALVLSIDPSSDGLKPRRNCPVCRKPIVKRNNKFHEKCRERMLLAARLEKSRRARRARIERRKRQLDQLVYVTISGNQYSGWKSVATCTGPCGRMIAVDEKSSPTPMCRRCRGKTPRVINAVLDINGQVVNGYVVPRQQLSFAT